MLKSRGLQAPYDGITEVWWEDQAALERGMASPEGIVAQAQLIEDESRFIDFGQSSIFMTEEHTIFDRTIEANAALHIDSLFSIRPGLK